MNRKSAQSAPPNHALAVRHLSRADPRLAAIIKQVGPYRLQVTRNPFEALIGSIVHQQVSMSAAASIRRRLCEACRLHGGARCARVSPTAILALSDAQLRAVGLSRQKVAYVRNIAEAFASKQLTAARLRRMSDDEVIAAATELKGVGRWTAEMLLIFSLERPDVWPVDDLGLRVAVGRLLGLAATPAAREIVDLAAPWRPYRSIATWYLWRSLEKKEPPAIGD